MTENNSPTLSATDGWAYRRRAVWASLIFIASSTVYLMVWGSDDDLRRTIASGLLDTGMWVLLGYIFGAIADDHLKRGGSFNVFKRQMDSDRNRYVDPDRSDSVDSDNPQQPS